MPAPVWQADAAHCALDERRRRTCRRCGDDIKRGEPEFPIEGVGRMHLPCAQVPSRTHSALPSALDETLHAYIPARNVGQGASRASARRTARTRACRWSHPCASTGGGQAPACSRSAASSGTRRLRARPCSPRVVPGNPLGLTPPRALRALLRGAPGTCPTPTRPPHQLLPPLQQGPRRGRPA